MFKEGMINRPTSILEEKAEKSEIPDFLRSEKDFLKAVDIESMNQDHQRKNVIVATKGNEKITFAVVGAPRVFIKESDPTQEDGGPLEEEVKMDMIRVKTVEHSPELNSGKSSSEGAMAISEFMTTLRNKLGKGYDIKMEEINDLSDIE